MDWGSGITYLAETRVKGQAVRFGIKDADRVQHLCVIGKTGSGKAPFVVNMALQDIARGIGTLILDSTGNVTQTLLERLPQGADERIIFLDPSDGEHPYSWNALDDFRALMSESASEEARGLLSQALASLYQVPDTPLVAFVAEYMLSHRDATMLFLYDVVADTKARGRFFPERSENRQKLEELLATSKEVAAAIVENGKYLAKDSLMRNVLGQRASKFTLEVLAKGGIVVVDLSRIRMFPTRIGPLVRLFTYAARARAGIAPTALYLHDCLRYLSVEDLERLLLERTVAFTASDTSHGEEEHTLREKMIHRAGSVFAFSPHEMDAQLVERALYPYVGPDEIGKLAEGALVGMLAIDSVRSRPFFAKSLPLPARSGRSHQDIALDSRDAFTTPRLTVDKLFIPKKEDEKKGEEQGSFSDAFRSIFTKRAAGDAPANAQDKNPKPPEIKPPQPKAPDPKPPAAKAQPNPKLAEIPEDELKKLLHVGRTPQ